MSNVLVITTGGTIGAVPLENPHRAPIQASFSADGRDLVAEAMATDFSSWRARCFSMEPRDSKDIDDAYRAQIVMHMSAASESKILITHGTDALVQTAEYLYARAPQKSIVITGAMVPLANGRMSDGWRNLDFSLACLFGPSMPSKVGIVLCGFETMEAGEGDWAPRYYPCVPGRYEKFFHPTDSRFNRLKLRTG